MQRGSAGNVKQVAIVNSGEGKGTQLRRTLLVIVFGFLATLPANAQGEEEKHRLAREIFKQLIEINTTDSVGNVTTAAEAMAKRLRDAGFPEKDVIVDGATERKKNLVARIHGAGKQKPVLFLAHLDVVEARREDWTTDPFQFVEKDGFFYGRGTQDIKDGDAILVTNFIRLKREGFAPDRDLILALTADEEIGSSNGVDWLLRHHRDWIDAEYCVNLDGGDFVSESGRKVYAAVQASEKVYADLQLEVRNPGGHSSRPTKQNAIYQLAAGLSRLAKFAFPAELNDVTRSMLRQRAKFENGPLTPELRAASQTPPHAPAIARLSEDPFYNSLLRTTCVATMLSGGHSPNALPQTAHANVNCRILPGQDPKRIRETILNVLADSAIKVTFAERRDVDGNRIEPITVPPSPLRADLMETADKVARSIWPGLPVIPVMEAGATDGHYLRPAGIPTYGISGVFIDVQKYRAHGQDEGIRAQDFYDGVEFYYRLIRELTAHD